MIPLLFIAQVSTATGELLRLDRQIQSAMVGNNTATMRRSIAPDFRFEHADGTVETKADVLRAAAATPRFYLRRRVLRAKARISGQMGVVVGSLDVASKASMDSEPFKGATCYVLSYVHTYSKRNGRWQFLRHQTTKFIRPERPCASGR